MTDQGVFFLNQADWGNLNAFPLVALRFGPIV